MFAMLWVATQYPCTLIPPVKFSKYTRSRLIQRIDTALAEDVIDEKLGRGVLSKLVAARRITCNHTEGVPAAGTVMRWIAQEYGYTPVCAQKEYARNPADWRQQYQEYVQSHGGSSKVEHLIQRINNALEGDTLLEAGGWRKAVATGLAGLGMMASPMGAKASGTEGQWEALLDNLWHQVPPKQRQELKQDEREWIRWKENLSDHERYNAIQDRAQYLSSIVRGDSPTAAMNCEIADWTKSVRDTWDELSPDTRQRIRGDIQNQMAQLNQLTSFKKVAALRNLLDVLTNARQEQDETSAQEAPAPAPNTVNIEGIPVELPALKTMIAQLYA
jgi:hypothetical protein